MRSRGGAVGNTRRDWLARARVTGPAPGSSAGRPGASFFLGPRPGCRRPSRSKAWRRGRPALIGQFVSDCSVMCYHNNPPREANRGRLFSRTGPTGCTKLHRAPSVPPLHSSHPWAPPSIILRLPPGGAGLSCWSPGLHSPAGPSPQSQVLPGAWARLARPAVPPASRRGRRCLAYPEPRREGGTPARSFTRKNT